MRHLLDTFRNPHRHLRRQSSPSAPPTINPKNPNHHRPHPHHQNHPKKSATFTLHNQSWEDQYSWMSNLNDKVATRHMDVYMEQEEKYTEIVMSDTEHLLSKLQSEMASRIQSHLSAPPLRLGRWLYYRRVEEGKQYLVLCQKLVSLNQEFISNKVLLLRLTLLQGRGLSRSCLITINKLKDLAMYCF